MVLSAELDYSSIVSTSAEKISSGYQKKINTKLTFDKQEEYRKIEVLKDTVSADSITYKSNAFEIKNFNVINEASYVKSSNETVIPNYSSKQQNGNSFWDYEPVGLVKKELLDSSANSTYVNFDSDAYFLENVTTQDSDGFGFVKNENKFYKPFNDTLQDFYKSNRRIGKDYQKILILKSQFEDSAFVNYDVWDSEIADNFYLKFNDSDFDFKAIDYSSLKSDSDSRTFKFYKTERSYEIAVKREQDFVKAMKENKELVYTDSTGTYYDYVAWEKLWNSINENRTRNDEGWAVKGYLEVQQNELPELKNKKRGILNYNTELPKFIKENKPYDKQSLSGGSFTWNNAYKTQINSLTVVNTEETTYKDPKQSMRGRRKW
jgi:hypothetical protein